MIQLILQGLICDDLTPLTHRPQTSQVAGGIEGRVGGLGEVDSDGQVGGHGSGHW